MNTKQVARSLKRFSGTWWVPGHEDMVLPGVGTYTKREAFRLELTGELPVPQTRPALGGVLLGVTDHAAEVTLTELYLTGSTSSGTRDRLIKMQQFMSLVGYIGGHLPTEQDRSFTDAVLSFKLLHLWHQGSAIKSEWTETGRTEEHRIADPLQATLDDGTVLQLWVGGGTGGDELAARRLFRTVTYSITSPDPLTTAQWTNRYIDPLGDLLNIATYRFNEVTELAFKRDGPDHDITVLRQRAKNRDERRRLHRWELLFTTEELPGGFASFMPVWFRRHQQHRVPLLMAGSARFIGLGHIEGLFLDTVQGIESFLRSRGPNQVLPKAEHKVRMKRLLEAAPGDLTAWLEDELRYSNEPTLADRLEQLLVRNQSNVGFDGEPRAIAERIAATRIYLTHRSEWARERAAPLAEIPPLMWLLWFSYLSELLGEVGFQDEFVSARLARDWRCESIRRWNPIAMPWGEPRR